LVALLGVSALCASVTPRIAGAHAIVVAAQPAVNSTVVPGELKIRLDFNSRIDSKRSRVSLRRPDGVEVAVALAADAPPGVLAGVVRATEKGRWTLRWLALSLDGHITRGEVSFSVSAVAQAP